MREGAADRRQKHLFFSVSNKSAWGPYRPSGFRFGFASTIWRRNAIPALLFVILLLSATLLHAAEDHAREFRLKPVAGMDRIADYFIADLDGDGQPNFMRLLPDRYTYIANLFSEGKIIGPPMYQGNSLYPINYIGPVEIDSLPGWEVAVGKKDESGDSAWVEIYAGFDKERLLCRTGAVLGKNISDKQSHENSGWDGTIASCDGADLDDDGRPEIIVTTSIAFDLYPRGIFVYDYPSGKLKWKFLLPGTASDLTVADANHDGFQEIYFKTSSPANGAVVGHWADTTSYVFCLDHLGNLLWENCLGDRFGIHTGNIKLCDYDDDGRLEIFYSVLLRQQQYDQHVKVLEKHRAVDNHFLGQRPFDLSQEFTDIYTADFDADGDLELLLDGQMTIVQPEDMKVLSCGVFDNARVCAIADLDQGGDNLPEIIISEGDSLYVVDTGFKTVGAIYLGAGQSAGVSRYFVSPLGVQCLALATVSKETGQNNLNIYRIDVVGAERSSWIIGFFRTNGLILIIGLLAGVIIGYFIKRRRQPRIRHRAAHMAQYNNLLTTLVNFDHGHMAGKNLNRLLFLFSNLPEAADKLAEIKPNLKSAIDAYNSFTSLQLQNTIENAERLQAIKGVVNHLSRDARHLSDQLREIKVAEIDNNLASALRLTIPEMINSVKDAIKHIMAFLQTYYSSNLLRVIPEVLAAVAGQFQQQGIGFSEITTKGGTNKLVFFDEAELASIFEEILSNASDAMAEAAKKELTMDIKFASGETVIRLSDTGRGLQANGGEDIFSREYSTKGADRGFGLYHARQQVERFGGRIKIYNNEGGPGATVELILRTVNNG